MNKTLPVAIPTGQEEAEDALSAGGGRYLAEVALWGVLCAAESVIVP